MAHIYNGILAIKRNEIELFVVRWMDLESVIQSEVSQKEINKYRMLRHIWNLKKMVLMNLVAGRNMNADAENGLEDMGSGGEG